MAHEVPFVPKDNVTILSIGDSLEAITIRGLLESFNYRVTVHWIGSRRELLELLSGNIETSQKVIISCHGIDEGVVIPDEQVLGAAELAGIANLVGKTVVNLGCLTGSPAFVNAFKKAGVKEYIAPDDYPEGRATICFISNLFFLLAGSMSVSEAVRRASEFNKETEQFKLFI
jgi:hypothetical protein